MLASVGVAMSIGLSKNTFISSQLTSGSNTQAWQAAKLSASTPAASASTQSGSAEHQEDRSRASANAESSLAGSAWATTPPRLPAESLVAVEIKKPHISSHAYIRSRSA